MKIACILMQKGEDDLLNTWITYHGSLFGFHNIFVFDNGSNSKRINEIYQKHILNGISIIQKFNKKPDFHDKGKILGGFIKFLDETENFDFYFPLDCDEFVAVECSDGQANCDIQNIKVELQKYIDIRDPLAIKGSYFNISRRDEMFFFFAEKKLFFKSKTFESMDEGFHTGRTKISNTPIQTNIVHFHFANKPYELGQLHAKEKLSQQVDDFGKENMLKYNGGGSHLKRFFIQSKSEYENAHSTGGIFLPSFKIELTKLGLQLPYIDYWK